MVILLAALLPAILLMVYIYSKDSKPEPPKLILKGFLFGGIATFVSTLISGPLQFLGFFTDNPTTFAQCLNVSFFGAAIPEECAKLLMLWLLLRNMKEFDERYDGIVYGASIGLGFASFENLLYVLGSGVDWITVSISRAFLAVPGHLAFAVVMGYYYSLNHFYGKNSMEGHGAKWKMLLYPILLHGIYDTIAFATGINVLLSGIAAILLLVFCFFLFKATRKKVLEEASKNSEPLPGGEDDSDPTVFPPTTPLDFGIDGPYTPSENPRTDYGSTSSNGPSYYVDKDGNYHRSER